MTPANPSSEANISPENRPCRITLRAPLLSPAPTRCASSKGRGKSAEEPDGGGDESYGRCLIRTQMPEHGSVNHLHGDE